MIREKTNARISLDPGPGHAYTSATYLGGIVSADRSIVYWVNETKPLP